MKQKFPCATIPIFCVLCGCQPRPSQAPIFPSPMSLSAPAILGNWKYMIYGAQKTPSAPKPVRAIWKLSLKQDGTGVWTTDDFSGKRTTPSTRTEPVFWYDLKGKSKSGESLFMMTYKKHPNNYAAFLDREKYNIILSPDGKTLQILSPDGKVDEDYTRP